MIKMQKDVSDAGPAIAILVSVPGRRIASGVGARYTPGHVCVSTKGFGDCVALTVDARSIVGVEIVGG